MSIEKINKVVNTPINTIKPQKSKKNVATEPEKKISESAKLMIGATILAGTIAIGIIGHKNNWWRKATQKGGNLSNQGNIPKPNEVQPKPKVTNVRELRTPEAIATEFERISARELQDLSLNKSILEEAMSERAKFIVDNPLEVLKAERALYKVEDSIITVTNQSGKPIQRIKFNISPNEGHSKGLFPIEIEYINPETGKLIKIVKSEDPAGRACSIRMFDVNENPIKELWYNNKTLVAKNYKNMTKVPNKVSVFDITENKMKSCIEYNTETGYPNFAYSQGNIYALRQNSTPYFDNILESSPMQLKTKSLDDLYASSGTTDIDFIMPRLTKCGHIIRHGNINFNPHKMTLLDFTTHQPRYTIQIDGNSLILKEFNIVTQKPTTLFIENGEIIGNRFGKTPKEVLEEMKEIFSDLTPNLYSEHTTKLPQLIQEFIEKLN